MVEVEEGGLGALEHDLLAGLERLVHQVHRVGDARCQAGSDVVEVAPGDVVGRQRQLVVDLGQDGVLLLEHHVELLAEDLAVEQVLDPQAHPGRLVGVGRPDPALGRAQLGAPEVALGQLIELLVVREDEVGVPAEHQVRGVDPPALQRVDLVQQDRGVDDHAVADDVHRGGVQDAARHQPDGEVLVAHHDGVAGVVAALVAHHHVHLGGEDVGQLPLALVAPLGAHDHRAGHEHLLGRTASAEAPSHAAGGGRSIPKARPRRRPLRTAAGALARRRPRRPGRAGRARGGSAGGCARLPPPPPSRPRPARPAGGPPRLRAAGRA